MENMSTPYLVQAQLVNKNMEPMENSLRKLSNDQVELLKLIKPCSVILDVLQGHQNFKVRCLIHDRYECRCIHRNQRHIKCLPCSGCSVQNKSIKGKKKNYRCQTKQSDISQEKKKMTILNCVNKQFSKENSVDTNICAGVTSSIVQEISNSSASKTLNLHDFSSSKPEEHYTADQCDKLSNIFVAVDSELVISDCVFEEDENTCKVRGEDLFADHKDVDYHLRKNVKIEQDVEGSSREIDINVQNLDGLLVSNSNDICTSNDRLGLVTSQIHPKIKEEVVNDEISIINESIISIELHPLRKIEELSDKSNDESETKNISIVHKPLKAFEEVQREMETNLQFQNKVETLSGTLQSDLQIKLETNSRDYDATVDEEEYVSKLCIPDENSQLFSGKDVKCQNQSNENSESHVDRPFGYTICEKAFTQLKNLIHPKCIHTGEKPFGCTVCGKMFTHLFSLTRHKQIHTGEKSFGCTTCGKAFTEQSTLTIHKRIHTGEKPFSCTICGKSYRHSCSLKTHKRIHTGEKPYGCIVCGKMFTQPCHLTNHKRIHTGQKPFSCTICGKTFTQLPNLTCHKRKHTGEKPFGCTICGKAFTAKNSLIKHKRIHTGEKPFCCTICGKAFTELSTLSKHKRIHTGGKSFGCTLCGKAFTRQWTLTNHKRKHTG